MKILKPVFLTLLIGASGTAQAATVTGQITYIGPSGNVLILDRHEAYAVAPGVSLADVSVKQIVTAVVSDEPGAKTITALHASQDHIP
jgi:hypothetical protein